MATYYIVYKDKDPLGPNEINAGTTIVPAEGDVFIITANANDGITFDATTSTNFDVQILESNVEKFTVEFTGATSPDITIADNVDVNQVTIDATDADSASLTIGDGVTLKEYIGSDAGTDTVVIGDNFTSSKGIGTNGGDDTVDVGTNASSAFDGGGGTNTITSYTPDITPANFETENYPDGVVDGTTGNDTIGAGYEDGQTDAIDGDDDTIIGYFGSDTIDGGAGNDTIYGDLSGTVSEPPSPTGTADVVTFDISDTKVGGGSVKLDVSSVGTPNLENYITITDKAEDSTISSVDITKIGKGDGQVDTFVFDLNTFDDDFTISIVSEGPEDLIHLTGVTGSTDNGDGTTTYSFIGDDGGEYSVTVDADAAVSVGNITEPPGSILTDDTISGGAGDDVIDGGFGADSIDGGIGSDTIAISAGADTIAGGDGTDTYDATLGVSLVDETIDVSVDQSGDGNVTKYGDSTVDSVTSVETFVADEVSGQTDTITITETALATDVSGISNSAIGTFKTSHGPIAFGGEGEPTFRELMSGTYFHPTFGMISPFGSVQIINENESGQVGNIFFENFEEINFSVVCYAPGTLIETPDGLRAVETLASGDEVLTVDRGPLPIRWIRAAKHSIGGVDGADYPILIRAGALCAGRPERDMIVSGQHRVLVGSNDQLEDIFDQECLVPAKSLVGFPRIHQMRGKSEITWIHFALDSHELVFAAGCISESLLLGPMVLNGLTRSETQQLEGIFGPRPMSGEALNGPPARDLVGAEKARRLINRTQKLGA